MGGLFSACKGSGDNKKVYYKNISLTRSSTVDDVCEWLVAFDMTSYQNNFRQRQVNGLILFTLDDDKLRRDLNIANNAHRIKILNAIALSKHEGEKQQQQQQIQPPIIQKPLVPSSSVPTATTTVAVAANTSNVCVNFGGDFVLIVGGEIGEASKSTEVFDIKKNNFKAGPSMKFARYQHASAPLISSIQGNQKRVIVLGGCDKEWNLLKSSEVYDSKTNKFIQTEIPIKDMLTARIGHCVVPITISSQTTSGLLVIGGSDKTSSLKTTEIYNISENNFQKGPNLITGRSYFSASVLLDGRVFVCGGLDGGVDLQTTEIYNPKTNSFSLGPSMLKARCHHSATTLSDGKVLITGGENGNNSISTEIYDPITNKFILGPNMLIPRSYHSSSLLSDGRVLISGQSGTYLNETTTTEFYNPNTNSFTKGPNLLGGRFHHSSTQF